MSEAAPSRLSLPAEVFTLDVESALKSLDTTSGGLSSEEAAARLAAFGPNRLPAAHRRNLIIRFLSHFNNVLIYVLLGAAAITVAMGHPVDTAVILAVVMANAVIGFIQEGRAEQAMESIRLMLSPQASVLRDGERQTIDAEALVPGDIVLLEAGDRVPADMRLLLARGLHIEEAILTGESMPAEKNVNPAASGVALGDRCGMAFSGTMVTSGQGRGVVAATGAASEIGRISGMLSDVEQLTTPLVAQMNVFARWLSFLIIMISAVLLVFGYFVEHHEFTEMFMAVVGLAVAAIPEGLPAVLTITLAIGVQAMSRRNVIVRRLPAIETLGSVSVICTDKTGTLTRNEMMVASAAAGKHIFFIEGVGYAPEGAIRLSDSLVNAGDYPILDELGRGAALCNDASLHYREGAWIVEGDPMEGALLAFSRKIWTEDRDSGRWPRVDSIPFDAKHRFMASLHSCGGEDAIVFVKGAPETVMRMCKNQRSDASENEPLDEAYWRAMAETIAAEGQRVLAFAVRTISAGRRSIDFNDVKGSLTLIGLAGLIDPPRQEAIDAVADCHDAGIRVKMITGDHAGTAAAIARQIGLKNTHNVLTGADLDRMDDADLALAAFDTDVFARTSPEHKLRLVTALQSRALTVAMTGDGVNDAPALKRADAGIAMGKKGSEAAKEAAELVLADDNFASIAAAVREGRTVYDNIKKVISWTLPTNAGEATTILVALLFGLSLPVTPIQILWVNLITAITLGLSLAFEPTEEDTMRRPPRPRNQPLLTGGLAWHIVLVSVLFLGGVFGMFAYATDRGYPVELARSIALNTLVVMEIFHLFFIRNIYGTSLTWKAVRGTRVVWASVIAVALAQFSITYAPPLQSVFATRPISLFDGMLIVGVGATLFAVLEVEKQLRLSVRRESPKGAHTT